MKLLKGVWICGELWMIKVVIMSLIRYRIRSKFLSGVLFKFF